MCFIWQSSHTQLLVLLIYSLNVQSQLHLKSTHMLGSMLAWLLVSGWEAEGLRSWSELVTAYMKLILHQIKRGEHCTSVSFDNLTQLSLMSKAQHCLLGAENGRDAMKLAVFKMPSSAFFFSLRLVNNSRIFTSQPFPSGSDVIISVASC